jgi:hypothetical protein
MRGAKTSVINDHIKRLELRIWKYLMMMMMMTIVIYSPIRFAGKELEPKKELGEELYSVSVSSRSGKIPSSSTLLMI